MASPISTGGGGVHFESRVVAYYLASLLSGGTVRGHAPASSVALVSCQRKDVDNPIDDIKIHCKLPDGEGRLDLQIKRTLKFGDNELFREVIGDCWATFAANRSDTNIRFGVGVGTLLAKYEEHGRQVLTWASQINSAKDFFERLQTPVVASDGMREFVEAIRSAIEKAKLHTPTDDQLWEFLRRFVVLYFDFEAQEGSDHRVNVVDRLRHCLVADDAEKATELWEALTSIADEAKPSAGTYDHAALIEHLAGRFRLKGQGPIAADFVRLHDFSQRVLEDVQVDILGSFIPRDLLDKELTEKLSERCVVEILGEAGSGKSALVRSHIENAFHDSRVLALSSRRLPSDAPGWEGFARHLGIRSSLLEVITEFSAAASPALLLDGAERIGSPGTWATINDIIKAIVNSPAANRWKILVTSRKNNLLYRQQVDFRRLDIVPVSLEVGDFSEDELDALAERFPKLRQLVGKGSRTRAVAKRPYLLRRMAESGYAAEEDQTVVSEVDLMLDFWQTPPSESEAPGADRIARQDTLIELGKRRLMKQDGPIKSLQLDPSALAKLENDDVIRHDGDRREVLFAHDVIEDWVLCFALHNGDKSVPDCLIDAGEPLRLVDSLQLLGQWRLERCPDHAEWAELLDAVSADGLQPRWRRAVLASPLLSTRAWDLLTKAEPLLLGEGQALLNELIAAMRTIEVDPNPMYLNMPVVDGLSEADLKKVARDLAVPRLRSWQPFINWFLPMLRETPPQLVTETSLLLETIARGYDRIPPWMAEQVAIWAHQILRRLSFGDDFRSGYAEIRRYLDDISVERDDKFRERLLSILLRCTDDAPQVVAQHLDWLSGQRRPEGVEYIIENSNLLVRSLPTKSVDFLLTMFIEPPAEEQERSRRWGSLRDFNELGIRHDRQFFSSSHLRPPFLALLTGDEAEGLRLIRGLCNAAMDRWRQIHREERTGTPLPVVLEFEWGTQEFWGHCREYTWNRGLGPGPYTVMSALMAVEFWMELEIEKGRDPVELFRAVLHENYCIGVVGACCAILLKYPEKCLAVTLPFLTSPKLWDWDVRRLVQDGVRNSNTIGHYRDLALRKAVAERNRSPHRKLDIRSLVPYVLLLGRPEQKQQLRDAVAALQSQPPDLEFAEHKGSAQVVANAKEHIDRMVAMCDVENYRFSEGDDCETFRCEYVPPPSVAPDDEFWRQHNSFNESTSLAMWAEKSLESGALEDSWKLPDAISVTRRYTDEVDYSKGWPPAEDLAARAKLGGLAGTAALTLQRQDRDTQEFEWATSVIREAAAMPIEDDGITFSGSAVSFHPVVMAAYGYLAVIHKGEASEEARKTLLILSMHPLDAVKRVVFNGLQMIWGREPRLCWEAIVLGTRLTVLPADIAASSSGAYGLRYSEDRVKWMEEELSQSLAALKSRESRELPRIPEPWTLKPGGNPDAHSRSSLQKSSHMFLWDQLPIVLFSQPVDRLFGSPERRSRILQLLHDLFAWTKKRIAPPWHREHGGDTPFEWTGAFMAWCALILPRLSADEREELVIGPVRSLIAIRAGEQLLDDLLAAYAQTHISVEGPYPASVPECWNELFDVLLSEPSLEWHRSEDFISSGFGQCVLAAIFSPYGMPIVPTPWVGLEHFRGHLNRWVEKFGATPAYFSHFVQFIMGPAKKLALDPAAEWITDAILQNAENNEFWKSGINGEKACSFFADLLDRFPKAVRGNADLFDQIVRASDVLIKNHVRPAAELQQRLSVLERRP